MSSASTPPVIRIQVLLVESDARVLEALHVTVGAEDDLDVYGACDPRDAEAVAALVSPEVALVDVREEEAPHDLALITRLSRRSGCRVLAMSVRPWAAERSRLAGAAHFIAKEEDVEMILAAIRAVGSQRDH